MTISRLHLQTAKSLLKRALRLLDPPPLLNVWQWAELRRRLGKSVTVKPGRYRIETAPFQKAPQESFTDPTVQTTVLYWAKRLGKTEMISNLHGYTVEMNPRNILVCYPTLDSAMKWSKQFLVPMVRSTPALRQLIKERRSREANNTILSKEFPGGTISAIGANSPSGFRQVQAPVVTCDEIDAMETGPEGDPVFLAFGRAENYPDSVQVLSSTATRLNPVETAEGSTSGSRIHDWWLKSDQQKWFVKNPCCGKSHVLMWANVKWPRNGKEHLVKEAYYCCPDCGEHWDDARRVKAIKEGEWRATAPFNGIRGFWLNGLNTPFPPKKGYVSKLHQFASEFLDAYRSGEAARIAWQNTFLCEPYQESAERVDYNSLTSRGEDYHPTNLPEKVLLVTSAADVQKDRIECETVGLGKDDESWGIEKVVLHGNTEQDTVWNDLATHLGKSYQRDDGVTLKIAAHAVDLRHNSKQVRQFIQRAGLPRIYPVYGVGGTQPVLVLTRFNKHYRLRTFAVQGKIAKDTIFARLRVDQVGPRYMHFPKGYGYDEEHFKQLTGEALKTKYLKGFAETFYEKVRERNEALDLRVYWLACLDILKPNLTAIEKGLLAAKPQPEPKVYELRDGKPEPEADQADQVPPRRRMRMSMI